MIKGMLVGAVGLAAFVLSASASEVIDQGVQIPGPPPLADIVRSPYKWAQSFTVGLGGTLAEVDLQLGRNSKAANDLVLEIRPVTATGFPTESSASALATVTLTAGQVPLWPDTWPKETVPYFAVDLRPAHVQVSPGQVLAIVLRSDEPDVPFTRGYNWVASDQGNDIYAGGFTFQESAASGGLWSRKTGNVAVDQGFRTVVSTPEPLIAPALLAASALLGRPRRR